jgi:hypothetical protein
MRSLLEKLEMPAGVRLVRLINYYSLDYGYLGGEQLQFLAEK